MTEQSPHRYLTKSRFKLAVECPTKLYYTGKPQIYVDCKQDDEFLQALAEGGFQVGELAKVMHPEGIEVRSRSHDEQVAETDRLLARDRVTIFEAAIRHGNLFARVDILRKSGDQVELIEVKAKSVDSSSAQAFRGARGGIKADMRPYLQDVAFQRHVLQSAHPALKVRCHLMMADKSRAASVDGLNQRFRIRRVDGRPAVSMVPGTNCQSIGDSVLTCMDVTQLVDEILAEPIEAPGAAGPLAHLSELWADKYARDERIDPTIGSQCSRCEFRGDDLKPGQRSGFHECWTSATGLAPSEIDKGTVLDLWNFRGKQELIEHGIHRLADVPLASLSSKGVDRGLSPGERQAMQVRASASGQPEIYLDRPLLREEMTGWTYPLHFIDFETCRVAIPFFAGQRPYENIAFQFSHHVVDESGNVEHRSEFLCATPGRRPNYHFARALRTALGEHGTVFTWTGHENTTLNAILDELARDEAPPADVVELMAFLASLTTRKEASVKVRTGSRRMVDLHALARQAFFHSGTNGSLSIKKVLPALLGSSEYLKQRYSQPIYGAKGGIRSLNFLDQVWWQQRDGVVIDPYQLLPPVFADIPADVLDALELDEDMAVAQGGAASMAYARLQFEDLAATERAGIEAALRRYCELDTLAMVMIFEAWSAWSHGLS